MQACHGVGVLKVRSVGSGSNLSPASQVVLYRGECYVSCHGTGHVVTLEMHGRRAALNKERWPACQFVLSDKSIAG